MRQKGDDQAKFRELLEKQANGKLSRKDYLSLAKRELEKLPIEERQVFDSEAIKLCAKNSSLKKFNIRKMNKLGMPKAVITAENKPAWAASTKSSSAGNLHHKSMIAEGCKVLITSNLWKESGLVNGAQGTVYKIVYRPQHKPPELPAVVFVEVPQYIGPSYFDDKPNIVPIVPITRQWFQRKTLCQRTALPLVPSYALTIHKSQGMTLGKVIVDLGDREFSIGLTYTALSRCKKFEDLAFDPLPYYNRMVSYFKSDVFKYRRDEDNRLFEMEKKTLEEIEEDMDE